MSSKAIIIAKLVESGHEDLAEQMLTGGYMGPAALKKHRAKMQKHVEERLARSEGGVPRPRRVE